MSDAKGDDPSNRNDGRVQVVGAEPVEPTSTSRVAHLASNRRLIVRRSLLATALGGAVPIPVVDEYVTGRVRAGLLMKIALARNVDLPANAADLMGEPKGGSTLRSATITAATLVALKMAWRKFFALLALGRGAEDMATTFQSATLFDHYCAKLHVGGAIDRTRAVRLRRAIHATVEEAHSTTLVSIFRDGGRVLARSLAEAPRWVTTRLGRLAQRWVATRGNPEATFDGTLEEPDVEAAGEEGTWLDRATRAVETRLGALGTGYLESLVDSFERRWREDEAKAAAEAGAPGDDAKAQGD